MYSDLLLRPKREKSILQRHPWIFSGAIASCTASDGDIVSVRTHEGRLLGYGFYDASRAIRCRMFEWCTEPKEVDSDTFWHDRFTQAIAMRKRWIDTRHTTCYRLLHAEGDSTPGIIADCYGNTVVLQLMIEGTILRADRWVQLLRDLGFAHIYFKPRATGNQQDANSGSWLTGPGEPIVRVRENNLSFEVNVVEGQKTGFFIDQRDNRALLGTYASGKRVLNTFCYTGGFSVYALAGGAKEVVSVDLSEHAMRQVDRNVELNATPSNHTSVTADCFSYLSEMEGDLFDLIVLDPPAFAKSKQAITNASRGYKQINLKAFRKIKPGGLLFTFSCSQHISQDLFRKIVFGAAADAHRPVRILHQLHQPPDHPISIYHPEGEYLKGLVLEVS